MINRDAENTAQPKQLRLWPGIALGVLLLIFKIVIPMVLPDALGIAMFGGLILGIAVIIWWLFFSRAPFLDRFGALFLMVLTLIMVRPFLHKSIAEAGMGFLFPIMAIPILCMVFVLWAVISQRIPDNIKRLTMAVTIVLTVSSWTLIQTGGINNSGESDISWRWSLTPEELLLTQSAEESDENPMAVAVQNSEIAWPGFRGANRDGIIHGTKIDTDWLAIPPVELWRQPVGPGWSSFAVLGDIFYTQEQRGKDEIVSCYNLTTGEMVWKHSDTIRFWESNAGAGPRGTPTISGDRIYTLGATGILNVLDINGNSVVWSRNVATDTSTEVPIWGVSSSPLIFEDMVIAATAGSLIAYDKDTGETRWSIPAGGDCYSSPHLLEIDGVDQILLQTDAGTISVRPADGVQLWQYLWKGHPIVQPIQISNSDILISADDRNGIRRISVTHKSGLWTVEELWASTGLKPYFNDSVVHNGFVYGFDGSSLACINVKDGTLNWQGGDYNRGQFILLADQDVLLVISETGDLALVKAVPDQFLELGKIPGIEGKTWNHPVIARDILLVRNAQEMAAFRLSLID
ncbi:MAG: PQQ-like beta-propeller repeat protein [Candidatus Marinimicrobia bacterium]|jgi:outer membrane protein assembly factor BamB|nr:PQQ-like beta-propeller repeat protein [Candidatus Neomarinimicrobiota bacterium]MBT3634275.1 PQQ-like beta-propeller repeat protein [Candidatus Neomarinimicrobiota bacterium]MBT3682926.1 PQQ-like beta-propeller repeat protein [Candidatus Neomarinimicrobiota bacterium]MBT3760084.1 PQQ-like beta-propeller repeat protein [Candidatus Neomarinimicrobiota bacterium]MBT3896149.1 PQQ-like beta-propeller repeat protein [Candidatus Neomarinimicrobiota bacterium]